LVEAVPRVDGSDLLQLRERLHTDLGEIARRGRPEILQFGDGFLFHAAKLGRKPLRKSDRPYRYG
jgi:hypothetical protein